MGHTKELPREEKQMQYLIKNPSGKYLSFDFQGKPRFFEGIDMSYTFPLETAQKIVEKFSDLQLIIIPETIK